MSDFDMGQDVEEIEEDTQEGKYLTFTLGNEEYGLEIKYVTEIIGIQKITELPDVMDYVIGVINLRGKVIPVIDVRLRFGMEARPFDERTCIIVTHIQENSIGLIVDEVSEVMDIPEENIEVANRIQKSGSTHFIAGFGKVNEEVKILLDVQKLLFTEELDQIIASVSD